jgi:mannose-6-phosphate isomerase-like protein (cupin superfamily)
METPPQVVRLADLTLGATEIYREFLRVPALSLGLYWHAPGIAVPQQPHTEDEVYYVIAGAGKIEIAGRDRAVEAGVVVYVPAQVPHHFHSVTTELTVLVFFAPAEGSLAKSPPK